MIKNFKDMEALVKDRDPRRVALAMAEEGDALAAIVRAAQAGIAEPVLVGDPDAIRQIARQENLDIGSYRVVEAFSEKDAAAEAVSLVKSGDADCLMKGKTATSTIMKAALNKEAGIRGGGVLSHIALMEPPTYHKMLIMSDAALNIAPDLAAKVSIVRNALSVASILGIETPKVAVVGAVEKVNEAMPATLDAALLSKMADRGQIKGCLIDGPFALDNALSRKSCEVKGVETAVGGDADILLLPDIEAANVLYKSVSVLTDYPMAGLIVGAAKPIILTSRADSDQVKYLSILSGVALS